MQEKAFFDHIRRFVALTDEESLVIASHLRVRKYLKNQFVVQNGDVCDYESFVVHGCLKSFCIDEEGNEQVVSFAVENWWIGDLGSFITRTPAELNVQCLESSMLVQIHYDALQRLFNEVPSLERFFRLILQNAFVAAQKRLVHAYSLSATDRYLRFREQYPNMEQRIPQYLIASYLGISKEFLSKIRKHLIVPKS